MHATRDDQRRQAVVPAAAAHGEQREVLAVAVDRTVFADLEMRAQRFDGGQHVVGVAALAHDAGAPGGDFRGTPGLAGVPMG